jgi:predicted transcriptional regulator
MQDNETELNDDLGEEWDDDELDGFADREDFNNQNLSYKPDPEEEEKPEDYNKYGVKSFYRGFKGAEQIAIQLQVLQEEVEKLPDNYEAIKMIRTLKYDYGRLISQNVKSAQWKDQKHAVKVLKNHWRWHEKNLSSEHVFMLVQGMGVPAMDLAELLGVSPAAVTQRVERYRQRQLPSGMDPDTLSDDQKAEYVLDKIYKAATANRIDRESVNAAKVFLELYTKRIERGMIEKWKQVEILAEFFFSRLLPAIHQQLVTSGTRLDIRALCLPLFEEANNEVQAVVTKMTLPNMLPKRKPGRPKKNENQ